MKTALPQLNMKNLRSLITAVLLLAVAGAFAPIWAGMGAPSSGGSGGSSGGNTASTTWSPAQSATGTDTVTFSGVKGAYQIWDLAATTAETFTLVDARAGTTTLYYRDVLKVCQPAGGNDTEAFANTELAAGGTGWSNETQRGYTLIASRCDNYCFDWDGSTFHDCGFLANVAP